MTLIDLWNLFTFQVVILDHLNLTNESFNDEKKLLAITDGFAPHAAVHIEQLKQNIARWGQRLK